MKNKTVACEKAHYEVTHADLPLSCPQPSAQLWNAHPAVFLPIEETGQAKCYYCGAEYTLVEKQKIT